MELCKMLSCSPDSLFQEDMDKRSEKHTNLRIEAVAGFRYTEYTVLSTNPEGDAIGRILQFAKENGDAPQNDRMGFS